MSGSDARALSRSLLDLCRMRKLTIATAESCTGGLVAGALTDIPGSSDVIDRGFVTYSNDAKRAMLGVKTTTLATFGAVSKETATAMAIPDMFCAMSIRFKPPAALCAKAGVLSATIPSPAHAIRAI
jgi:nicotinamide mononucleotide (NMN) deamidase PncC